MNATIETNPLFESTRRAERFQGYLIFIVIGYLVMAAALLASLV